MRKHTPGPWVAFPKAKYGEWHVSVPVEGQGWNLGLFPDGIRTGSPEADARLIAAAPELLAALELAEKAFWGSCESSDQDDVIAFIRAAIAKATGEQP